MIGLAGYAVILKYIRQVYGLVPSGNKLLFEPMLTKICVVEWQHKATLAHVLFLGILVHAMYTW